MTIKETEAKSILRKHEKIDSWFISHYGMNIYRGCTHNCIYCDGRSEGYYVEGEFGKDSPYGYAAYSISKLKTSLSAMKGELRKLKGVGRITEAIILEILETGSSSYYEKLLNPNFKF